jgi:diguanylate cyclase (GGDEF)-like protein
MKGRVFHDTRHATEKINPTTSSTRSSRHNNGSLKRLKAGVTAASRGRGGAARVIPANEIRRMRAVRRYEILDTAPEHAFDRITALAAHLLQTPIALISIVDSDRIWFKSHYGTGLSQTGRDPGLCASAIFQTTPWVIADARSDQRTSAHPLVTGDFGLRFYAGAPLTTSDGHNLGTLCVIDKLSREVGDAELATLQDLAALVMDRLELRLTTECMSELDRMLLQRALADEERTEEAARHDSLTGLGNRRKLEEAFSAEIDRMRRHGGSLCALMADINHFRQINDLHGYDVGDEIISGFAELLRLHVRPTDIVIRLGGDEFLVLMPHTHLSEAYATAARLGIALTGAQLDALPVSITASFGVAELKDGECRESLLHRTDRALYRAKRSGCNEVAAAADQGGTVVSFETVQCRTTPEVTPRKLPA